MKDDVIWLSRLHFDVARGFAASKLSSMFAMKHGHDCLMHHLKQLDPQVLQNIMR